LLRRNNIIRNVRNNKEYEEACITVDEPEVGAVKFISKGLTFTDGCSDRAVRGQLGLNEFPGLSGRPTMGDLVGCGGTWGAPEIGGKEGAFEVGGLLGALVNWKIVGNAVALGIFGAAVNLTGGVTGAALGAAVITGRFPLPGVILIGAWLGTAQQDPKSP
jgi:hypothetical protein